MILQLPGAFVRAVLVLLTVLLPSLLLQEPNPQVSDAMVLLAICAAIFTSVEYASAYPGLVEFRDAPPFNRVRFGMLAVMLFLITLAVNDRPDPSALARLFAAVGDLLGQSLDLPFSPVRLVLWLLPENTLLTEARAFRTAAGLAYLSSLVGLTIFAILIRIHSWPAPSGAFNVWINLPTFDPTAGADVVTRLKRDGLVNILLGILLPYLTPPIAAYIGASNDISLFESKQMLVWTVSLWAFLPASLFLRGIAMRRLALMISMKRRRFEAESGLEDPAFLPA